MSHEIRTPMNAVIGLSNILSRTALDDQQQEYLRLLRTAGKALMTLLNDILDFSKVEAGQLVLEKFDFRVADLVDEAAELVMPQLYEKKLQLITYVDPRLCGSMHADASRIRQILVNLLSNAIKFTDTDKGYILLQVCVISESQSQLTVHFSVTDQGIGISDEESRHLFQPFTQADGSTSRRYGGTGLGLSISKRLVELMNGEIGVTSEKGKGSTFWFTLLLDRAESPQEPIEITESLKGLRVLAVDRNPHFRRIIKTYLKSWGMHCSTAKSGKVAMRILGNHGAGGSTYDLIIVDMILPDMTGVELLQAIKKQESLAAVKTVLITTYDQKGREQYALELGFDGFLSKPLRQSQLLDCLNNVILGTRLPKAMQSRPKIELPLGPGPLILLAEDNPINQLVAVHELEELGFAVHVAGNGKEALQGTAQEAYSLILMDCQMPEMDGYEATREIRQREALTGRHVPIVAMTAHALVGDREKCLGAGMDDYISKPFERDELQKMLAKWLSHSSYGVLGLSPTSLPATQPTRDDQALSFSESPIQLSELSQRYSDECVTRLLQMFLSEIPTSLDKIKNAIAEQNAQSVANEAHSVKGVSSTVFASRMFALSSALEQLARNNCLEEAPANFEQLSAAFAELQIYVTTQVFGKEQPAEQS